MKEAGELDKIVSIEQNNWQMGAPGSFQRTVETFMRTIGPYFSMFEQGELPLPNRSLLSKLGYQMGEPPEPHNLYVNDDGIFKNENHGRSLVSYDLILLDKEGRERFFFAYGANIGGNTFLILFDITQPARAFSGFMDLVRSWEDMGPGVCLVSDDDRIVLSNTSFAADHGFFPEELVGRSMGSLRSEPRSLGRGAQNALKKVAHRTRSGRSMQKLELEAAAFGIRAIVTMPDEGQARRLLGMEATSEQKCANDGAGSASAPSFDGVLKTLELPVYYEDRTGTILGANQSFEELTGLCNDSLRGINSNRLLEEIAESDDEKDAGIGIYRAKIVMDKQPLAVDYFVLKHKVGRYGALGFLLRQKEAGKKAA